SLAKPARRESKMPAPTRTAAADERGLVAITAPTPARRRAFHRRCDPVNPWRRSRQRLRRRRRRAGTGSNVVAAVAAGNDDDDDDDDDDRGDDQSPRDSQVSLWPSQQMSALAASTLLTLMHAPFAAGFPPAGATRHASSQSKLSPLDPTLRPAPATAD